MPRKSLKTASDAKKSPDQGVDTSDAPKIAQKPEEQADQGKPVELPAKKKTGRPSKYTPEIAQKMCEMLSDGIPLREICRQEGFPEWRTVYDWMYRDDALGADGVGLSAAIARAREVGQEAIAEQIWLDMLAEPERILSEGGGRIDSGYVQLIKARADIGLKLLAKWNPKRYGDRVTHAGDPEAPLQINNDAVALLAEAVKNLELRRNGS
jgi:hypothetical protein